jgi:hypothetical protein
MVLFWGQMGHVVLMRLTTQKRSFLSRFKQIFNPNVLFVPLKKTAIKSGISKSSNFID